jgi:hypothetical protein
VADDTFAGFKTTSPQRSLGVPGVIVHVRAAPNEGMLHGASRGRRVAIDAAVARTKSRRAGKLPAHDAIWLAVIDGSDGTRTRDLRRDRAPGRQIKVLEMALIRVEIAHVGHRGAPAPGQGFRRWQASMVRAIKILPRVADVNHRLVGRALATRPP